MEPTYYGLRAVAKEMADVTMEGLDLIHLDHEDLVNIIAVAMARAKYGDKVAYVDANGVARDRSGAHFLGLGQGADAARY